MSLTPSLTGEGSYREKRRRTRPDRKMRVRLYMSSKEKEDFKEEAEGLGFTMTSYASEQIKQVIQFAHRYEIEIEEIRTQEAYIHIKLSVEEHYHLRKYAQQHNVSLEQACFSWFQYSKLPSTKHKADEKEYLTNLEDDFWDSSTIEIAKPNTEGSRIY